MSSVSIYVAQVQMHLQLCEVMGPPGPVTWSVTLCLALLHGLSLYAGRPQPRAPPSPPATAEEEEEVIFVGRRRRQGGLDAACEAVEAVAGERATAAPAPPPPPPPAADCATCPPCAPCPLPVVANLSGVCDRAAPAASGASPWLAAALSAGATLAGVAGAVAAGARRARGERDVAPGSVRRTSYGSPRPVPLVPAAGTTVSPPTRPRLPRVDGATL